MTQTPVEIMPAGSTLTGTPKCRTCGCTVGTYAQGDRYRRQSAQECRECRTRRTLKTVNAMKNVVLRGW